MIKGDLMETTYCPHCGTKHFKEELLFSLLQKINGYKIDCDKVIIEQSAKKLSSSYTYKCVACGYEQNREIKH